MYPFLKGHGTENDFVLLPDHDGFEHGALSAEQVRAICDRRAGIGGDGVLRVIRTEAMATDEPEVAAMAEQAEWFMDYRNSDGSVSEMCGNGIRVFAQHLIAEGLVKADQPVPIATRAGLKHVMVNPDETLTADLGSPRLLGYSDVSASGRTWSARHVDMGNPHAVAFVDDLAEAGPLLDEPTFDRAEYPEGVNVEFVVREGERHWAMRVHERGSGETRSCGTGACAVMVAVADAADDRPTDREVTYRVDVPGGTLNVTWTTDDRVLLTGPAEIVAAGIADL